MAAALCAPFVAGGAASGATQGQGGLNWPRLESLPALETSAFALVTDAPDDDIDNNSCKADDVRWLPRLTYFTENDGGFIKPNNATDRYYTAGNVISLTFHPRWADNLATWLYDDPERRRINAAGLFIGQLLFTPENLHEAELIEDDRPYAGYLHAGGFWQSASDHALDHVRLEVGLVGSNALGDRTQEWTHTVVGGDDPRGWGNQLGNEVTVQGFYRRKWKLLDEQFGLDGLPGAMELLPDLGLALGTVRRHAELGATLRYGINLPVDFGPARLDDLSGTGGHYKPGFGAYGFSRISGRAVQHDMFIHGSDFHDGHSVEAERWVGRVEAGARLYYRHTFWNLEAGYSQTYISPQFKSQRGSHAYGSLTLSMTMSF